MSVAVAFNDCINRRDPRALGELMTDDHAFIDAGGTVIAGRAACVAAWEGFFAAFPDYRNTFSAVREESDVVTIAGRSDCSEPSLRGPALWRAGLRAGKVATWQVYDDTAETRRSLGIPVT